MSPPLTLPELCWLDDRHLRIGDVQLLVTCDVNELHQIESSDERFLLGKTRGLVEDVAKLGQQLGCRKLLDIGIFKGGSVVLYDQLFAPERLVAIELARAPAPSLTRYIERKDRRRTIRPYYNVNQADAVAMRSILVREFPGRDIDLIVDDASHLYAETRAAFQVCLPYLRPGGMYIVEDWAWAHWQGDYWQKGNNYFGNKPALTNLLIECGMLAASRPDIIRGVIIKPSTFIVERGPAPLDEDLRLERHYLLRGKRFEPWL